MSTRSEQLINAAKRRASIIGFLNSYPEKKYTALDISKNLGLTVKDVTYTVDRLVDSNLINLKKLNGVKYFSSYDKSATNSTKEKAPAATKTAKGTKVSKNKVTDKDVELVIGGVLIVVGRNEGTGRLRITITES